MKHLIILLSLVFSISCFAVDYLSCEIVDGYVSDDIGTYSGVDFYLQWGEMNLSGDHLENDLDGLSYERNSNEFVVVDDEGESVLIVDLTTMSGFVTDYDNIFEVKDCSFEVELEE